MIAALDRAAAAVLAHYPATCHGDLQPLGNGGGFSGARLWRVAGRCLRAWPLDDAFPVRLDYIHHLMTQARDTGLAFVPRLELTTEQTSRVEQRGRWWELTEWLTDRADYRARPTRARLESACAALARLHLVWGRGAVVSGLCPAVERRFVSLRKFRRQPSDDWNLLHMGSETDPLRPLIARAVTALGQRLASIPIALMPWTEPNWPLQPCLCDVWHDHLLFEDDRLTGIVDYGSVKLDHVAVDLARMLGSLVEDDDDGWQIGLTAYRAVRPLTAEEEELARVLDRTGTVVGVANWLRWLYAEGRPFENRDGVAGRLGTLVTRIERWGV